MLIVLDTNVYYENWKIDSPNFQMLQNFCNNMNYSILLPNVTAMEVNNKYNQAINAIIASQEKLIKDAGRNGILINPTIEVGAHSNYNIQEILCEKFGSVLDAPCSGVEHSWLIEKALKTKLPFRASEKGYRDSLFWLSVLVFIRDTNHTTEVAFITNNTKDFSESSADKDKIHSDLIEDFELIGINPTITFHTTLKNFIDAKIPKEAHGVAWTGFHEQHSFALNRQLSNIALDHLDNMPLDFLFKSLGEAGINTDLNNKIFAASFVSWDGIKSSEIKNFKVIDGTIGNNPKIFIEYKFHMNLISVDFLADVSTYHQYKYLFQNFRHVSVNEDHVEANFFIAANFEASVIYSPEQNEISQTDINSLQFIPRNK